MTLPRAAKTAARAKIKALLTSKRRRRTCLWDRLPVHLHAHIRERAVEAFAREHLPNKVWPELLTKAMDRKLTAYHDMWPLLHQARGKADHLAQVVNAGLPDDIRPPMWLMANDAHMDWLALRTTQDDMFEDVCSTWVQLLATPQPWRKLAPQWSKMKAVEQRCPRQGDWVALLPYVPVHH